MRKRCQFWLHLILILAFTISTSVSWHPVTAQATTLEVIFNINGTWESLYDYSPGDTAIPVRINVGDVSDLAGFEFKLWYKPSVLTATKVVLGGLFPGGVQWIKEINETIGYVWYAATASTPVNQGGTLALITFTADSPGGASCLYLEDTKLSDSNGIQIPHDVVDGHFVDSPVHDIGITKVTPSSSKVTLGETVGVTVVARNHGDFSESFNVTVYANTTAIGTPNTQIIDLLPGYKTTLTFTWITTGVALGKYIISANATTVQDEMDSTDNTLSKTLDFSSGANKPHFYVYITVTVRKNPVAIFEYSPELPHVKEPVVFNASKSTPDGGTIETYQWDFGDTNRTSPSLYYKVHNNTFVAPGTYNVTLTIMDSDYLTDTTWKLVTIYPPDVAVVNVTTSTTDVVKPNPVLINVTVENKGGLGTFNVAAYYDSQPIGPTQIVLSLKEGTRKNLTFTWDTAFVPATTAGTTYRISAEASILLHEANTTNNRFVDGNVTVYKPEGPSANFTYSPKKPAESAPVTFNASLTTRDPKTDAAIVSYAWDFGDGSKEIYIEGTNITQIVTHSYTTTGPYTVRLNVTDSNGLWDATETTVTIHKHDLAIISVDQDKIEVIVGEQVSIDVIVKNEGDFNETFDVSAYANTTTIQTSTVTLQNGTLKTVTLTWDTTGVSLGTYIIKAEVPPVPGETHIADNSYTDGAVTVVKLPVASFTYSPASPTIGDPVTFNASASTPNGGIINSYIWSFGDSNITTVTDPIITHTYAALGSYTVTLNVTDTEGYEGTTSKLITVGKAVSTITIIASPSPVKLGESTKISGSITPTRQSTDVGIFQRKTGTQTWTSLAAVSTNLTSKYSYTWTPTAHGTFELKANWTGDAITLQAESNVILVVEAPPTASFTYTPSAPIVGDAVTFTSTSTDADGSIQKWDWNLGDDTHSNSETTTHTYATAGDFTVTLTVTDNDGLTDTKSVTITVSNAPTTGIPLYLIAGAVGATVIVVIVIAFYFLKKRQ